MTLKEQVENTITSLDKLYKLDTNINQDDIMNAVTKSSKLLVEGVLKDKDLITELL